MSFKHKIILKLQELALRFLGYTSYNFKTELDLKSIPEISVNPVGLGDKHSRWDFTYDGPMGHTGNFLFYMHGNPVFHKDDIITHDRKEWFSIVQDKSEYAEETAKKLNSFVFNAVYGAKHRVMMPGEGK